MFKAMKRIINLSEKFKSNVYKGILYGILDSFSSCLPLIVMYFFIMSLADKTLNINILIFYTLALIGSSALGYFLRYKEISTISSVGYSVIAQERKDIGGLLKSMALGQFYGSTLGEINTIITHELTQIELYGMQLISKVVSSIATLTFTFILLWTINPILSLAFFSGLPLTLILGKIIRKMYVLSRNLSVKSHSEITDSTIEYTQGLSTIKAYNVEDIHKNRMKDLFTSFSKNTIKKDTKIIPLLQSYSFVMYMGLGIVTLIGSRMYAQSTIDFSLLLMFLVVGIQLYQPFEILSAYSGTLTSMNSSLDRLEYLNHMEVIAEGSNNTSPKSYDVQFKNVSFKYDHDEVIKNISFSSKENSMTAIVGSSGSGKTTLMQLLLRFWDLEDGEILIGNNDIRSYSIEKLMDMFSVVFQDNYLFKDTIANNIRFGKENASKEDLIKASKKAMCHDFIMALPEGYDTLIGEGGSSLSGGEKQRIAIARAILKDSPIIILDEATSGVDPINEVDIQESIHSLIENKTVFVIAHKFSSIIQADNIIVMDKGEISQIGRHDELCMVDGLYKRLWEKQTGVNKWKIKEA
ncbi:MAG: ABC transporter ATP-binding protein/permease [Firmicutes bacterium]|jgi:ATP-binding cassette subfamily B protein|nr:ABC transporter ATP-binding protein/permease [Bacillota bacterium]